MPCFTWTGAGSCWSGPVRDRLFEDLFDDCFLQCVGEVGSFVGQRAGAVVVFSDGGPFSEKGVVIIRKGFGVFGHEEFGPVAYFVFVRADVEGVVFEGERFFQVRKFLVAEAGGFAQRARERAPSGRLSSRWRIRS